MGSLKDGNLSLQPMATERLGNLAIAIGRACYGVAEVPKDLDKREVFVAAIHCGLKTILD